MPCLQAHMHAATTSAPTASTFLQGAYAHCYHCTRFALTDAYTRQLLLCTALLLRREVKGLTVKPFSPDTQPGIRLQFESLVKVSVTAT
jgi:hypothetical protein